MGEFSAGRWIVGLSLYFFILFVVVFSAIGMADEYGLDKTDLSVNDPGFNTAYNQYYAQGGQCTGYPYAYCSSMELEDETTCNYFTDYGCSWTNGTLFNTNPHCTGYLGWNAECTNFTMRLQCQLTGCTWTNWTSTGAGQTSGVMDNNFDWSSVKNTIGFLSGFRAGLGIPAGFRWVFSFIFFWIPGFMLIWAIYMALPFLH